MDYTRKASIQRKTLWQQIADVLREDIIRGKIKPGERIVEEDIAEKFHVSRGPVREALRHIGEEGFVVYESHKGSTVKTISYEEMQEKYLVRSTLEVLAIRIIAGKLPEEIEREMDECLEQMEKAAKEKMCTTLCVMMNSFIHALFEQQSAKPYIKYGQCSGKAICADIIQWVLNPLSPLMYFATIMRSF